MSKQTSKRQLICISASLAAILFFTVSFLATITPKGYGQNEYKAWAEKHGILLIGTSQDADDLYYDGFDEDQTLDPALVNGFEFAMRALMLLPDYVLPPMEPQYNSYTEIVETKAIYFSTASGRGYAMIMPKDYSEKCLMGVYPGFILEQKKCNWAKFALHECGHIVDYLGITGEYEWETLWSDLAEERDLIFDAEGELISSYAKTNPREDFAEHFSYYVSEGPEFRARAQSNVDLQERYDFFKWRLFKGREYEGGTLEGVVEDEQGVGVPNADVRATRVSEPDVGTSLILATTNSTGGFCARNIECREYAISAEKWGYVLEGSPQTVYISEGEVVEITIPVKKVDIIIPPISTDQLYHATIVIVLGLVCVGITLIWIKKRKVTPSL